MTFSTITTKYPGACGRCGMPIPPGTRVRYGSRRVWHFSADCTVKAADSIARDYNRPRSDFARQQAGERSMEDAMDRAYAGETQDWESWEPDR